MLALIIVWLIGIFAIAFAMAIGLSILILLYTLPYCSWIHKQHIIGHHTDWPRFNPRYATKLYLAKLTRSAI